MVGVSKNPIIADGIVLFRLARLDRHEGYLTWDPVLARLRSRPNSPYYAVRACNSTLADVVRLQHASG